MTNINNHDKNNRSRILPKLIREFVETLILAIAIFIAVNIVTARFKIEGNSMLNSFQTGQYIIVNRLTYQFNIPERGDVIVFIPPMNTPSTFWENILGRSGQTDYIKRIIGIPGDIVEIDNGKLFINGNKKSEPYLYEPMKISKTQQWQLTVNQYLVLGDNRNFSKDSRMADIGPITIEQILGKVWIVYFPIQDAHIVQQYTQSID